jgi:hypothetical protein
MQDASMLLLSLGGCVLFISVVLMVPKQTRKRAILFVAASLLIFGAIIELEVFHNSKAFHLLILAGDILIVVGAVLGLVNHHKSSTTRVA